MYARDTHKHACVCGEAKRERGGVTPYHFIFKHTLKVRVEGEGNRGLSTVTISTHKGVFDLHEVPEGDAAVKVLVCHTQVDEPVVDHVVEYMLVVHVTELGVFSWDLREKHV